MKQKVLSLCFPTYNRGWCMKEQIERLNTCPKEVLDKIEIIISDNCSTDDTQEVIEYYIRHGFECRYIRHSNNIGADPNFIHCMKEAKGRYVWLLGDDDIIIITSLVKIVEILDTPKEYGLIHIYQKEELEEKVLTIRDKVSMMKYVSYYVTFISANIVNSKYVHTVDLVKYIDSWLMYVPVYLTALHDELSNIVLGYRTFGDAQDYNRNGGYNYFKVFVQNYLTIINEFIDDKKLLKWLKKDIWPFVWQYTKQLLIHKEAGNFKVDNGWKILFKHYGTECYFWWSLIKYPFAETKRKLKRRI